MSIKKLCNFLLVISLIGFFQANYSEAFGLKSIGIGKSNEETKEKVNIEDILAKVEEFKSNFEMAINEVYETRLATIDLVSNLNSKGISKELKESIDAAKNEAISKMSEAKNIASTAERWEQMDQALAELNNTIKADSMSNVLKKSLSRKPDKVLKGLNSAKRSLEKNLALAKALPSDLKNAISSFSTSDLLNSEKRKKAKELKEALKELLPFVAKKSPELIKSLTELSSSLKS